ncbi:MAG: hypothetical protein WC551_11005 [Patescibacteria group bacterium]
MNQTHRFPDGSFVVHKIYGERLSAWFAASGTLEDIEAFYLNGKPRRVTIRDKARAEQVGAIEAARLIAEPTS